MSIFAVCGWMFTESAEKLDGVMSIFIAAGLIVFFVANLSVLKTATEFAMSVKEEIASRVNESNFNSDKFNDVLLKSDIKYRLQLTVALHLGVDSVLIIALVMVGFS
ncbi:hypothetical protein [Photobacterium sanguinicancri]|uniref:hypothetical protein n=1 Tax=Photobacterium sanguinicancri TaxID=875932 RepID=UPI0021C31BB5|nr:hypothetical protein [Photobacterium sanguinicancri]